MNMPLVLLNRRRRGSVGYNPAGLFALNEPGIWLDPSDLTTMFQDRAGSTAVTTPGQSVGLRLDKSKGLVLGAELVTNGDFSGGTTGWTVPAGWTITGGAAVGAATNASLLGGGVTTTVAGRTYRVDFDVVSYTSGNLFVTVGGNFSGNPSLTGAAMAPGRKTVYVIAGASPSRGVEFYGGSIAATIDNVSVKELPGNHAVANSDAARGIYGIEPVGGRRNLLTFTEQFDNAVWSKIGTAAISANTSVAPDGTNTADRLSGATGNPSVTSTNTLEQVVSVSPATTYTFSVNVAGDGGTTVRAVLRDAATGNVFASDQALGAGFSRVAVTITTGAATTQMNIRLGNTNGNILIWGAQLETGSTATPYQRVTTQYDVTEAGKQTLHYVQYDGSDDGYVTPTITPGIDKVQVWAAIRKLSDSARGTILELSSSIASNNGAMQLTAPNAASATYAFESKGTALADAVATPFAAPLTSILTGLGDIAGDSAVIQVNGVQSDSDTGDQGTGNYLAAVAYLGRRNAASQPFNGRDYGVILRFGPNLSASTISSTNLWLSQKAGVTL